MKRDWNLIKGAKRNFELARRYRSAGNSAVATLLYSKAVQGVLRALYLRRNGRDAPEEASLGYLASRTSIPEEVEDYIVSVMEPEESGGELELMEISEPYVRRGRFENSLLYLDGLTKRLLDCAGVYG